MTDSKLITQILNIEPTQAGAPGNRKADGRTLGAALAMALIAAAAASGATAPTISMQPQSQKVTVGQEATFSVVAAGTAPLSYRRRRDGQRIRGGPGRVPTKRRL